MKRFPSPQFPSFSGPVQEWKLADWVELQVMSTGYAYSIGDLDSALRRNGLDRGIENRKQRVWDELERRARLTGRSWPLIVDTQEIFPKSSRVRNRVLNYYLCAVAFESSLSNEQRETFEHCTQNLLQGLTRNPVLRLGHPRRGCLVNGGIPADLDEAIGLYCHASKAVPGEASNVGKRGDAGLDLATWFGPDDGRSGRPHFLGQCATGDDWTEKLNEPPIRRWESYVKYPMQPMKFLVIPYVVSASKWLDHCRDLSGFLIDRPRLLRLASQTSLRSRLFDRLVANCRDFF